MISLPKALILAFILKFIIQFVLADPKNQLGFAYTSVSNERNYGRVVAGNILQFIVIGDIGGEEYESTVADSTAVKGTVANSTAVKKHRTTESQKAVAKAMDELSQANALKANFLLNTGDNFYANGVTFADVIPRFTENFEKVYHYESLDVPWYTIAGNNDWKGPDGIRPQIETPEGKWTFPAQQYVVHYTFENGVQVRIIMIDTTVLCGTGSSDFRKCKDAEKENEKDAKKENEKDAKKVTKKNAKKETEKNAKKETEKDAEKHAEKHAERYAKKIANAKKHFTWLRKELREAKRRRVNFLFVVGHYPLHTLDKQRAYPCAARMHALMRYYQVQAYFAGHEHNLKYVDLSNAGELGIDSIDTKFIVSGAGSRMENAISRRFPEAYIKFMKFLYPMNVGEVLKVKGEETHARGALDGGAFVGVEIDAKIMLAKLNFYAAGMFYNEDGTKKPIENWHKFEGQEVQMKPRRTDKTDENFDICNEFLEVGPQLVDDDHFKLDETERIQNILGTYFFYAGEAFDGLRKKLGIGYQKLAESFLSGDLVAQNPLGKSSSLFYRTSDKKFVLKNIHKNEVDTIKKTLPLFKMGEESSRIYLVFRINTEKNGTKDAHEFYAVTDGKTENRK
uniref:Calcineurin-like phosphoesterase domain-containing protein n=1 Tax=Globodera rostochiensis TaxID=31243 RepID=A0A914I1F0_GLORO